MKRILSILLVLFLLVSTMTSCDLFDFEMSNEDLGLPCVHEYEDEVTKPTCTAAGFTTHTCKLCGDSYKDSETAAVAHKYADGTCSVCGKADPNYVPPHEHNYVNGKCECGATDPNAPTVDPDLQSAYDYVHQSVKGIDKVTGASYEILAVAPIGSKNFQVKWEVSDSRVTVEPGSSDNLVKIVIPKSNEEFDYVLTFTVTNEKGETLSRSYTHTVPVFGVNTFDEYMAAAEGDNLTVMGIVVAINSKAAGNTRNHLFLADPNVVGGYYSYQMDQDPVADLGIEVGMTVLVNGPAAPYSGMMEIKGGKAEIIDTNKKTVDFVDVTTDFANGDNLSKYTALPVVIKGVTIGGQQLGGSSDYLYFELNGHQSYVRTYVTDFPTTLAKDAKGTIDAAHAAHRDWTADVYGIVVLYNSNPYLIPLSVDCFDYLSAGEKTPAEKIETELSEVKVSTSITAEGVVELPTPKYNDVTFAWVSNSEYAVVNGNTITVTIPDEGAEVVLTLTVTCGEASDSKEFTIKLSKDPISILEALEIAGSKEHNNYTDGKYLVAGYIVEVYNTTYGNMKIRDAAGNILTVYGTYSADGSTRYDAIANAPVAGDYVIVLGVLGQYNGTPQMKNGWIVSQSSAIEIPDANDLGVSLGGSYTEDKYVITGEITEIVNDKYGNLYIKDADGNTFYIYGLYTEDGKVRFDAMTTKPAVGDTISILTTIGSYNGSAQAKNAWLIVHEPAGEEPPHEHNFVDGKCECGEEDPNYNPGGENPPVEGNDVVLTVDSLGIPGQTYASSTATVGGVSFEFVQIGNYGDGIQVRDKNGNTSTLWNTTAFPAGIEKIVLVYSSTKDVTYANADCEIFSFGNGVDNYTYTTKLSTTAGEKTYTITPDVNTYTYFKFEHDLGYTMYWESITIVLADGSIIDPPTHEHNFVDGKCECGEEDPNYVPPVENEYPVVNELKDGYVVIIGAPAYNMALSATKTGYYNIGVDYSDGFSSFTDAELFVVTVNADGSYTFTSKTGKVIALADDYSSLNEDGANKSWELIAKDGATGIFYLKNTVRGNYLEWYASKNNWSTYATSSLSDLFELSFYLVEGGSVEPPHEHNATHVAAVEANCHQAGNVEYWYCADCKTYFADEALTETLESVVVPATVGLTHVAAVEAACHQNGCAEYWYCTECEAVFSDADGIYLTNVKNLTVPYTAEIVHVEAVAPTCTENGNLEYWYCSECNYLCTDAALTQTSNYMSCIVPATGHNYNLGGDFVFDATADLEAMEQGAKADGETLVIGTDGFFTIHFSEKNKVDGSNKTFADGYVATQRLNMGGKTVVGDTIKNAIEFTTDGSTTITIWWVCGGDGREIDLYDANGNIIQTTATGCTKNSLYISTFEISEAGKYYIGSSVGSNYYFKVAASFASDVVVTAPTCTEGGYTTYTCSTCGESHIADEVEALGHSYVGGVCGTCGEAEPAPTLPGSGTQDDPYQLTDLGDYVAAFPGGYDFVWYTISSRSGGYYTITSNSNDVWLMIGTDVWNTVNSGMYGNTITIYVPARTPCYFGVGTASEAAGDVPFTVSFEVFVSEPADHLVGTWTGTLADNWGGSVSYTVVIDENALGTIVADFGWDNTSYTISYILVNGTNVTICAVDEYENTLELSFVYDAEANTLTGGTAYENGTLTYSESTDDPVVDPEVTYDTVIVIGDNVLYFSADELAADTATRKLVISVAGTYKLAAGNLFVSQIVDADGNVLTKNDDYSYTFSEGEYVVTFSMLSMFSVKADTAYELTVEEPADIGGGDVGGGDEYPELVTDELKESLAGMYAFDGYNVMLFTSYELGQYLANVYGEGYDLYFTYTVEVVEEGVYALTLTYYPRDIEVNPDMVETVLGYNIVIGGEEEPTECEHNYVDGTCTLCGAADPDYVPTECQHNSTSMSETYATCTEDGIFSVTCDDCGEVVYSEITPATGHSYVDGVCSACGAAEGTDEPTECAHEYEQNTGYHPELVAATCCTPGVAVFECIYCDHYYTEETPIDSEAHAFWGDYEIITEANCATQTNGLKVVTCANGCGATEEQTIYYEYSHNMEVQINVEATCTTDGEYLAVCTLCGYEEHYTSEASGHYNWYMTCGDTGECMACGEQFTIEHSGDPATCTEAMYCYNCWSYVGEPLGHSYVDGVCSACGEADPNYNAPNVHENVTYVPAVEANCHQNGCAEYWLCVDCDTVFADEALTQVTNRLNLTIPYTAEIVHVDAVEAACHQNGCAEYWYCAECDAVFADAALTQLTNRKNLTIPYTAEIVHVDAVEANCHQNGCAEYWYCAECDAVFADAALTQLTNRKNLTILATAEIIHVEAVAATCTENGNLEYWYCSECDAVFTDAALTQISNRLSVVVPAGHTAGDEATCTTAQTCTVCNEELVAALGHTAGDEATCTTAQTCTVCNEELVAALGHDYVDYVCSVCGQDDPDHYFEMSVADTLASVDGKKVSITGVVISAESWNTTYKNMSVTIKDENGDTIYVFRLATQVGLGDTVVINGVVGSYNGDKQIAAGATATITVVHGDNHTYGEDGVCTVCGTEAPVEGESTVNCDFSTVSGTQYADETKTFGDVIVSTHNKGCHFNTQLRIYDSSANNGWAILTAPGTVNKLVINCGYKKAALEVYGSVDGETWVLIESVSTTTTSYMDYTVEVDAALGYNYIKFDAVGAQIRVASITVTYAE